jgi:benzoylformate decarboxylase
MSVQPPVDPRPDGLPVIQIGLRDWELGKVYPAEMALNTNVKATMAALAGPLRERQSKSQAEAAAKRAKAVTAANWSTRRDSEVASIREAATATPIDPAYLMLAIAEALPRDGVLVDEGLTSSRSLLRVLAMEDPQRYFGLASGGIGWGLPGAIGVQMALPDRPMIALSGDGSAMYSIQALWTAANMKLPITFVIANNGGYRILKQRLFAFDGDAVAREKFIGMEFNDPEINFTALAESLGVPARSITDPSELPSALQEGLASGAPSLLNVHVYGGYKS